VNSKDKMNLSKERLQKSPEDRQEIPYGTLRKKSCLCGLQTKIMGKEAKID